MKFIKNYFLNFKHNAKDIRLAYFIMGSYQFSRKQIGRGIVFLLFQLGFIAFMASVGWRFIRDLVTLGVNTGGTDPITHQVIPWDDAFMFLLLGVLTIFIMGLFLSIYFQSIGLSLKSKKREEDPHYQKPSFKEDLKSFLDKNFYFTMLIFPLLFLGIFLVVPLIFMILIAFTNYGQHPSLGNTSEGLANNFFNWAHFRSFGLLFGMDSAITSVFFGILAWTLAWAVLATASNYILGIIVAMLINKKGIRGKKIIRLCLVISIAVPQFVTLMTLRTFLDNNGILNQLLMSWGIVNEGLGFLSTPWGARATVLVANLWIGIPFTMLIATGILMNIPEELYEAARIDGAGPVRIFFKITMPFVLFVTTPYLITQFIGNINNFNVIFLLTGGGPYRNPAPGGAGYTDLLITWLFGMTMGAQRNYSLASVIGIMVFVVSATFSLIFYRRSATYKREGEFA